MSSTSESSDCSTSAVVIDEAQEIAKANLYFVLSRAFVSPVVMTAEDPALGRRAAENLPEPLASELLDLAGVWEDSLAGDGELALAYARLFLGPFNILAPPYASFYLEPDHRLMGPVSQSVAMAYSRAGLAPGPGPREAPDHVSLEWEYMYFVTHQFLATGESSWIELRNEFVSTHLSHWMPLLANTIKSGGAHIFYNKLSVILGSVLNDPDYERHEQFAQRSS